MSGVRQIIVGEDEGDQRLDRWLRRHVPHVTQGRIERMCRKGEIRVDGARVRPAARLVPGQSVRLPPMPEDDRPAPPAPVTAGAAEIAAIRATVIYRDSDMIAINKPPGLAVQGGSGQRRHVDMLAAALVGDGEARPKLVHRLDRDTSGVLLLALTARAAAGLAEAFRGRGTRKVYWAAVAGCPTPRAGTIRTGLVKAPGRGRRGEGEKMLTIAPDAVADTPGAKRAVTEYRVIEAAGRRAAWMALSPVTGRTHQLRAHMAAIGHPIIGDGKYGSDVKMEGRAPDLGGGASRKLHLHARSIALLHPVTRRPLFIAAPLPDHMARTWALMGWREADAPADPFAEEALPPGARP
jgi:23S rRNA pseudouridine955/2504/2580 synthase